jgi:hypothetical protein
MVSDLSSVVKVDVVDNIDELWDFAFDAFEAGFFLNFPDDSMLKSFAKFDESTWNRPFAPAGLVLSFLQKDFAVVEDDSADADDWLVRVHPFQPARLNGYSASGVLKVLRAWILAQEMKKGDYGLKEKPMNSKE